MKPSLCNVLRTIHHRTCIISATLSQSQPPSTRRRIHTAAPDTLQYLESFRSLINSLSKNPRNYKTLTTLDSFLSQTQFSTPAVSVILIDFLSQIKKLQRAKAVVVNLKCQGKVSDQFLYGLIFDFLVKDGNFDDVETVWAEICGSRVTIGASDYVIHVCKYGSADEIKRVCDRVLIGGRTILGRQSFVALIGGLCNVNECSLAKEVAIEMLNRGIPVDDLSYFVMFQCFCRNGDVNEADLILRKLGKSKFHFDVSIYGSFLHSLCKSGKLREANKLFHKLIKKEVSKKVGNVKEGRRAIFQMSCEGAVPEIIAYEAYFRSLCSAGMIKEAEILLKDMIKKRNVMEVCVYGSFIKALFGAGRAEDALKFFKKGGAIRREDMARYVIAGLCENGRVDEAWEIWLDAARGGEIIRAYDGSLNHILDGYWKEGRVVEAERLFERLKGGGGFDVCETMMNGYCSNGNVSKAVRLVEEMVSRKMCVKQRLYGEMIKGLCECGRVEEGLRYYSAMLENGNAVSGNTWKLLLHPLLISDD